MTERPILFSAPMVRANRDNRKTQTRRTRGLKKINEAPEDYTLDGGEHDPLGWTWQHFAGPVSIRCPYGFAEDQLWVRESFYVTCARTNDCGVGYRSDHPNGDLSTSDGGYNFRLFSDDPAEAGEQWNWAQKNSGTERWKPSIFMPRWASRDTLELVSVRPERLQSITEEDAMAEGCEECPITDDDIREAIENPMDESKALMVALGPGIITAKCEFMQLWDSINGPGSWAKNPWVWRLGYRRLNQ